MFGKDFYPTQDNVTEIMMANTDGPGSYRYHRKLVFMISNFTFVN